MDSRRPPSDTGETRRQSMSAEAPAAALELQVVEGRDAGLQATIDPAHGKILIGTGPTSDLRLTDPTVSRRHASIEHTPLGVLLADLDSTNGTFVGDSRVVAAYIGPGVRLRVGSTVMQARAASTAPSKTRRAAALGRMASASPRMTNVLVLCERLAASDVPIVLEGETGTGKERLAEAVHEASGRADGPFVVFDCRTTPRELVEAYLFGERRPDGSVRLGVFEAASGGTLFVDEPGDLSIEVQAKLLRALDKGTIVRVGDPEATRVGARARVITATTRDLDRLVEEGLFRDDLYFRLAGARVEIPPLRRRREDIPLLAGELWAELGGEGNVPDELLERYEGYDWPGNVRELERAIEQFLVLGDKVSLAVARKHRHVARPDLPDGAGSDDIMARVLAAKLGYSEARQRVLEEFERAYLEKALADAGGNVARAAAASGIARRHFQRIRARQK